MMDDDPVPIQNRFSVALHCWARHNDQRAPHRMLLFVTTHARNTGPPPPHRNARHVTAIYRAAPSVCTHDTQRHYCKHHRCCCCCRRRCRRRFHQAQRTLRSYNTIRQHCSGVTGAHAIPVEINARILRTFKFRLRLFKGVEESRSVRCLRNIMRFDGLGADAQPGQGRHVWVI